MKTKLNNILQNKTIRVLLILQAVFNIMSVFYNYKDAISIADLLLLISGITSTILLFIIISSKSKEYILSEKKLNIFVILNLLYFMCAFLSIRSIDFEIFSTMLSATGIVFIFLFNFISNISNKIKVKIVKKIYVSCLIVYLITYIIAYYSEIAELIFFDIPRINCDLSHLLGVIIAVIYVIIETYVLPYLILNWMIKNIE